MRSVSELMHFSLIYFSYFFLDVLPLYYFIIVMWHFCYMACGRNATWGRGVMWHFCYMGRAFMQHGVLVLCIPMWHFCYIDSGCLFATNHGDEFRIEPTSRIAHCLRNLRREDVSVALLLALDSEDLDALKLPQPAC